MIYAILDNTTGLSGTVKNAAIGNSPLNAGWIDVTAVTPRPEKHWTYDGTAFTLGVAPVVNYGTHLTRIKFKQRMTSDERIAIRAYAVSTAQYAPVIFDFMDLLSEATFIDVSLPETRGGVNYLEGLGLLGTGRATEILDTPITQEEAFNG
jgi:hypothetical protein